MNMVKEMIKHGASSEDLDVRIALLVNRNLDLWNLVASANL
jgi:hypothetical protein